MTFALPSARGHEHGTRARYVVGCRCDECRAANTAFYHERHARAKEAAADIEPSPDGRCPGIEGEPCPHGTKLRSDSTAVCHRCRSRLVWNGLVDAGPARNHIRRLSRRQVGDRSVADAAGVARSIVAKIRTGEKKRIRKRTRDAILEVDTGAVADHAHVPAGPTWTRLRELEIEYLTKGRLALALGYKTRAIQIGKKRVLARTEMKVRRLHERVFGADGGPD